ncbi:MAG: ATP-binding protein [Saprospiraceae bacterium]|nr:MAG: ATP-binding protein [Saprospiraceae bacterium]
MIQRSIEATIRDDLANSGKIIIVYGPRQVGKTTLVQKILKTLPLRVLEVNADQFKYHDVLSSRDLARMKELVGNNELLFIDEAQNISNIGINLKILRDNLPELKIIATGSSSFELANKLKEPLTGRTSTFQLYPIALQELAARHTPFELKDRLETYLLYGMYPEVLTMEGSDRKIRHLRELTSAYLYKDVLQLANLKHADKIVKLLKLLAFQVGSLVSLHELGKSLEMSHETVNNYIDLLEKGFVLFRLTGFSRNLRKEVNKMSKIYFYDTGIRNMLIENFNPIGLRHDIGALWENFLLAERIKKMEYQQLYGSRYFWRTYSGAELDYVEERAGQLSGFEFKWKAGKQRPPASWPDTYHYASYQLVNRDNFLEFVL